MQSQGQVLWLRTSWCLSTLRSQLLSGWEWTHLDLGHASIRCRAVHLSDLYSRSKILRGHGFISFFSSARNRFLELIQIDDHVFVSC